MSNLADPLEVLDDPFLTCWITSQTQSRERRFVPCGMERKHLSLTPLCSQDQTEENISEATGVCGDIQVKKKQKPGVFKCTFRIEKDLNIEIGSLNQRK